jgi:hypothetical protein
MHGLEFQVYTPTKKDLDEDFLSKPLILSWDFSRFVCSH